MALLLKQPSKNVFLNLCFFFYFVKVWTSFPNEGGQVYFLGPAATEHPEQNVLPDGQWNSGTGTRYGSLIMHLLVLVGEF